MATLQNALLLTCQSHKLAKPALAKPLPQPVSPVLSSFDLVKPLRLIWNCAWHLSTLISSISQLRGLTAPSSPYLLPSCPGVTYVLCLPREMESTLGSGSIPRPTPTSPTNTMLQPSQIPNQYWLSLLQSESISVPKFSLIRKWSFYSECCLKQLCLFLFLLSMYEIILLRSKQLCINE